MNKSKHTPGPWRIAKPKNPDLRQIEDRLIYTIVDNEKFHIAEVYQYHNDTHRDADGSSLANTALIVDAPELLRQRNRMLDAMRYVIDMLDKDSLGVAKAMCKASIAEFEADK